MSQLVLRSHTIVDSIPIGRRIAEIMKEKGKYYTISAMANRIGIHRETYRMMLKGERDIYTFELEKIAIDLKVSSQRILQEDIMDRIERLNSNLSNTTNLNEALEIALELEGIAIGITEKCKALHRLGHSHFLLHQYEESHNALNNAHVFAQKILDEYGENELLFRILFNLVDTFMVRNEYGNASKILQEVEPHIEKTPSKCTVLYSLHARINECRGDLQGARTSAYESLNQAQHSGNENMIARAKINAAHFEYRLENYRDAKELLEEASELLTKEDKTYYIARKDLIKTLIKLDECECATMEIMSLLTEVKKIDFPDMEGKLLLLLSRTQDQSTHATTVVENGKYSKKVRLWACRLLTSYYRKMGDSKMLIHYNEIAEELNGTLSDILDEGEF